MKNIYLEILFGLILILLWKKKIPFVVLGI